MKVLFLDIDGVANCATTAQRHNGFIGIDPYMAFLIGKIKLETGCEFVLSSSWRHYPDGPEEVERCIGNLHSKTPRIQDPEGTTWKERQEKGDWGSRGNEIKAWLAEHAGVEKYAIVDDDNDMLPEQQEHFFKTSWTEGITAKIAAAIAEHLQK